MAHPLMPKATAVWLVENTALTFKQIAEFCGLHQLEVQAIADDEVAMGMQGLDPVACGELTQEELDRCIADSNAKLVKAIPNIPLPKVRQKGARYTPVSKRQDRPDAIAWLVKNHPELSDAQISKLIGTTKPTINAIRERSHWNMPNIKPQNPIALGLCITADLEKVVSVARTKAGIVAEPTEPVTISSTPGEMALSLKPGEVVLLKGEAKAERERALELEGENPVFNTGVPEAPASTGNVRQNAEDVFSARPSADT
ncbi:MAG: DUF1013 domain-containing protein [Rhodospirillales bacterium]|nr:DUF1013 domain-containing protein [Rhodospirillales bacterium]